MKTAGNKVIYTQKFKFPEIQISKKTQKTRNHASYRKLTNIIKNFKVLKKVENPNSGKQR